MNKKANTYYIVVEEWLYPTESGREVIGDFDTIGEALDNCRELAEVEMENFVENCKVDCLDPECYFDEGNPKGYIITPKNGLDEWIYAARVVEADRFV